MIKTIETEIARQEKETDKKSHVRKTNPNGTTTFLRPMPGAARMYPETDIPLLKISREMINYAKNNLPKLASEHKSYLDEFGLNDELVKLILKENKVEDFKTLNKVIENPELIAKTLTIFSKEIAKKSNLSQEELNKKLNLHTLEAILEQVGKKISENEVKPIMQKIVEGKSLDEAMEKSNIDLKSEVESLIKQSPNLSQGAYMGLIMAKFKGQVSGKEVADELKKRLE
jgi:glutamyl-tRNA(Gln) amidotransferase subunit E